MKRILLTITIVLTSIIFMQGQEIINKKFIRSKYGGPPVEEKKAKFVELTIKEADGTLRYETRNIKSNELTKLESYKDGIPVGKWITGAGTELNYDFELKYDNVEYINVIHFDIVNNKVLNEISGEFEAPIFPESENNFRKFIAMNLRYPVPAQENGIQGKVISQFIIDETGKLIEFSIMESADKVLDKEAARVILKSPDWIPAKLDGVPVRVHIITSTVFVLQ